MQCDAMQCNAMRARTRTHICGSFLCVKKKQNSSLMLTGYVPTHVVRNHFIYFPCSRDLWSHKTSLFLSTRLF
jgi:hypothetical protein